MLRNKQSNKETDRTTANCMEMKRHIQKYEELSGDIRTWRSTWKHKEL